MRLQGSRNEKGVLSSKAMGEPPLLLSASALSALHAALAAARQEVLGPGALGQQGGDAGVGMMPGLPASMECVKGAVGAFDLAAQLRAALKAAT
jgi:hypothetical protein